MQVQILFCQLNNKTMKKNLHHYASKAFLFLMLNVAFLLGAQAQAPTASTIADNAQQGIKSDAMVLEFNTTLSDGTTVTLPLYGSVNVTVDWGDGTTPQAITTTGDHDHTYATEGTYTVSITGSLSQFGHGSSGTIGVEMLTKVTRHNSWGLQVYLELL